MDEGNTKEVTLALGVFQGAFGILGAWVLGCAGSRPGQRFFPMTSRRPPHSQKQCINNTRVIINCFPSNTILILSTSRVLVVYYIPEP